MLLAPFHNRRWDNEFQTIQKLLLEGSLGRLVHFESTIDRWRTTNRVAWKDDSALGGGLLLDLGTHLADQAIVLFGKPEAVSAELVRERDGEGSEDSFTVRLRYPGLWVTLSANYLSSLERPRFHLRGTKGNFVKIAPDPQEAALGKVTRIADPAWGQEAAANWGTLAVDVDGGIVTRPVESVPATIGTTTQACAMCCWARLPARCRHCRMAGGAADGVGKGKLRTAARNRLRLERRAKISEAFSADEVHSALNGSFSTSGTQKRKLVPCPGTLEASMPPPCAARMARVIARPIPEPLPPLFLPR